MRARTGLTLVEVLIATVLMAIVVGSCVPILRQASRTLGATRPPLAIHQLASLADQFIEEPSAFGLDSEMTERSFEIQWPGVVEEQPPVLVRHLEHDDPVVGHGWLIFTCDGASVARWLRPTEPEETD